MRDTTTAAERAQLAAIRALAPSERLRQAFDLSETARRLALSGLRMRYPNRTDLELIELYVGTPFIPPDKRPPQDAKVLSKPFHLRDLVREIDRLLTAA